MSRGQLREAAPTAAIAPIAIASVWAKIAVGRGPPWARSITQACSGQDESVHASAQEVLNRSTQPRVVVLGLADHCHEAMLFELVRDASQYRRDECVAEVRDDDAHGCCLTPPETARDDVS